MGNNFSPQTCYHWLVRVRGSLNLERMLTWFVLAPYGQRETEKCPPAALQSQQGPLLPSPAHTGSQGVGLVLYLRPPRGDCLPPHFSPAFMLSCSFPRRPDYGDVTVMDLHSGGVAHFHCHLGYELQGAKTLTCINASKPHWSSHEPVCSGTRQPQPDQHGWLT